MSNDAPKPFIKGKYVPGHKGTRKEAGSRLSAHLKYAEHRSMGEKETREDRYIFSQESDHVARKDAIDDVMNHTSSSVYYHTIILSPGEHEHVDDFKTWTRDIMDDLQERKGVDLHWYAVVQAHERQNTSEPHVHLVVSGAGESAQTADMKTVRMDVSDYLFMKEQGREHSNFEFYQSLTREMQELQLNDTVARESELDQTREH